MKMEPKKSKECLCKVNAENMLEYLPNLGRFGLNIYITEYRRDFATKHVAQCKDYLSV